jgi:hypothetical protein
MANKSFNDYILRAVEHLYGNYRLLGYDAAVLTHDVEYGSYGMIERTGGGRTMCVAAMMEVILTAMQLYAADTGDDSVWDFLPKESWERLNSNCIKAHLWVNYELKSGGTGDALRTFGMGENVPFRELRPGSFVNLNRENGTGHAVVFLSHIDVNGTESESWNEAMIGFRYFSSQGGYEPGTGGLDYRYAIFVTDEYEQDGYPPMPYKRDLRVIYSENPSYLNTGIMWHPDHWIDTSPGSPQAQPVLALVSSVGYAVSGGPPAKRHLEVSLRVLDDQRNPVEGATVSCRFTRNGALYGSVSGVTEADGDVVFVLPRAKKGVYSTEIHDLSAAGMAWDGQTPQNEYRLK